MEMSVVGVLKAARVEQWSVIRIGLFNLYQEADILKYHTHRLRTRLNKNLGWRGRGLCRDDSKDVICPTCGEFAIQGLSLQFLCIDGHKGYAQELWEVR